MQRLVFLMCLVGVAVCDDVSAFFGQLYDGLDKAPHDGIVVKAEWDSIMAAHDANGDDCITLMEYKESNPQMPQEVAVKLFLYMDLDADNCNSVQDLQDEFKKADFDDDKEVSAVEYELYLLTVIEDMYDAAVSEMEGTVEPEGTAETETAEDEPAATGEPEGTSEPESAEDEPMGTSEPEGEGEPMGTSEPEGEVEPEGTSEPEGEVEPMGTSEPEGEVEPEGTSEPEGEVEPEGTSEPEGEAESE